MTDVVCNFYGLSEGDEELNALPAEEPEFYEVETTLDTRASTLAADRVDFPGYEVKESPGSRAGQLFGCAGGKFSRTRVRWTSRWSLHLKGQSSNFAHR